jgi:hypothetical protein
MISDWIVAQFKGIFGETQTLKIKVTGWNMYNPFKLLAYLIPFVGALVASILLVLILKYLFGAYTLKMAKE